MATQPDLLDRNDIWNTRPLDAFGAFVVSDEFVQLGRYAVPRGEDGKPVRSVHAASAKIYADMFANFIRWIERRHLRLPEVAAADIMAFLDSEHAQKHNRVRKLRSSIRVRYLRLLERVYTHLQVKPNPARDAAFDVYRTGASGRDKPKVYLTEAEQAAFLDNLPSAEPLDESDPLAPTWTKRRDRAMLAIMLGAGLKVSEARTLRVADVGKTDLDGSVPVRFAAKNGGKERETVLRPFAVRHVQPWIAERRKLDIQSTLLFPSSLGSTAPLHKATVYRHVKATLERAGIDVERRGGRTLRNSFAVRELQNGAPLELVKQYMGHHELRSTQPYDIPRPKQRRLKLSSDAGDGNAPGE